MKLLFSPAIALMNRMGYNKKFALLWLMCLVAIVVLVYNLFVSLSQVIRTSQQELEGIALIKPISQSVQHIQQHRGLSAALLGGNAAVRDRRAAKEKEAVKAFDAMEEKLTASLKATGDWQYIKASWERLRKEGLGWAAAENFSAHTRLIDQTLSFGVVVADQYKLTLDPQIDTYYLLDTAIIKLPNTLEFLGQLRAYGVGILVKKQVTESEKITLYGMLAELHDSLNPLVANLDKIGRHNPAIQSTLAAVSRDIADSARQVAELVKSDILTGQFATPSEDFYRMTSMGIDGGYAQMHESLLPMAETLLKARTADAENTLYLTIGLAFVLILVVGYFAAGIYYATIDSIQSLARSSRAFAGGNLRERIKLDTHDELAQVGDSFNEMADGFNALLEARRQTEDALNQFKNTLDQTHDCVFMFSPGTLKFSYANRGAAKQVGYSIEELLQMTPLDIKPELTPESFRQMLEPMLSGRQAAISFETMHQHKDGHLIPVEIVLQYIHQDGGESRFVAIVRDVTERKQAEKYLKESQEKFRALFEGSNDAIMLFNGNHFIDCNARALELFGVESKQEFILLHPADLSPLYQPDGRDSPSAAKEKIMYAFEHGSHHFEWMHRRKNDEEFPAEVVISAINFGGEPILQATVRDISKRKQAEDRIQMHYEEVNALTKTLRESQRLLDSIVEHIPVMVFVKRASDLRFELFNRAGEKLLGYARSDLIGKGNYDLWPKEQGDAFTAADRNVLASREITEIFKEPITIASGETRYLHTWKVALCDEGGAPEHLLGISVDITERITAEEKLRDSNKELLLLNHQLEEAQSHLLQSEKMASIGQLAAGVAHEINNPIGYVYSNLGTLEKYVQDTFGMLDLYEQAEVSIADDGVRAQLKAARDKLDLAFLKEDLRALMNESKDGITRVKKIVQNLKDFSHIDVSDEWHFSDLHSGIDSTLNIVNNEIKYKANVVKEYGELPEVECLSSQLNQVFMNLLVNAAHAIEERGTITIRTGQQGDEVWVEVADTGKGIAPEHIKKIFDPFFTTKPVGQGTGLGLSLSYGIVQKHHGRIEVQSEVGKGTTFRVCLPVRQPPADVV